MYQVVYNKKLQHKCILILLNPRLLYIGLIQAKGHLSFMDTCPDSYSYVSVICILYLAAFDAAGHLSILV